MDDLTLLHLSPAHRGEQLGLCQKQLLKQRVADFKAICDKLNLGPLELPDRARQITTTLNVLGQEWLIEARAVAAAAQIPTASYVSITYPPERVQPHLLPKRANDSTALGATSHEPHTRALFLENCDGPDIPHHVISRASSPGSLAYIALSEAGDIGIKAFVNEAGVAGTYHIGPQVEDYSNAATQPGLLLRQVCERATSCAQAVTEFSALQKQIGSATPDRRGVCYLLADSAGEVLLIESTGSRFQHFRAPEGFIITTNRFQLTTTNQTVIEPFRQRCLREHMNKAPVSLHQILNAAKLDRHVGSEKGVCDADTRASFVASLGAPGFPSFALVTLGTPVYNFPIPLFPRIGAPRAMVDGTFYKAAVKTPDPTGQRAARLAEYEQTLLTKLAAIPASAPDEVLMAFTHEMWSLAQQLSVRPTAEPAKA